MNSPSNSGESTCKERENGDKGPDERPLKKARFAWQVKGKYHLKQDDCKLRRTETHNNRLQAIESSEESSSNSSDIESDPKGLAGSTEQNLEILGDYLLKQDFNTLESVITDGKKSDEKLYPRYVASFETERQNAESRVIEESKVPVSLVDRIRMSAEDEYLARWQARQMAKGFVDNTINRVLDSWFVAPLPVDMPLHRNGGQQLALDVAEFINNLPCNDSIENEGILMAISAHGLQNTSGSSIESEQKDENERNRSLLLENVQNVLSSSESDTEMDEILQPSINVSEFECEPNQCDPPTWRELERPCICSHTIRSSLAQADVRPMVPFHHRNPLTPYAYMQSSSETQESNQSSQDQNDNLSELPAQNNEDSIFGNHFDFMDAAVSFAIQNKGLTSTGTEYG